MQPPFDLNLMKASQMCDDRALKARVEIARQAGASRAGASTRGPVWLIWLPVWAAAKPVVKKAVHLVVKPAVKLRTATQLAGPAS